MDNLTEVLWALEELVQLKDNPQPAADSLDDEEVWDRARDAIAKARWIPCSYCPKGATRRCGFCY